MNVDGLFRLNPNARGGIRRLGGRVPVLLIDDVFAEPEELRRSALEFPYKPAGFAYPGKIAELDPDEPSLKAMLRTVLNMVNAEYLPRIPAIAENQRPITAFSRVLSDLAITDVHPNELEETQRKPHVDPVPIFGLVYLNPIDRGGTLFFNRAEDQAAPPQREGYFVEADEEYEFVGKIEGNFNRLAIYPGFIPHTAEVSGSWIEGDERFRAPRLTQRLVFFP